MIFDFKIDSGFTCNAILAADGHKVDTPHSMEYSLVISRDSVLIVLIVADINGLDMKCAVVHNEYLNTNTKERVWFWYGK